MIESLTHEALTEHVGSLFSLDPSERIEGAEPLTLELVEVFAHEQSTRNQRVPFSAVFYGPEEPFLPQSIYPLQHAAFGPFDLFLVPIGPGGEGKMAYEAIFT